MRENDVTLGIPKTSYTRTFDWVMASDRGKQPAYCKVCSKHFSVSHGGIDDVRRHGEQIFKKITDFPRVSRIFFFRNLTCLLTTPRSVISSGSSNGWLF